jgi:hypothetical protein
VRTIIQTIGPLYGEIVNGTVFGQPNGDIARPSPNVPTALVVETVTGTEYVKGVARAAPATGYDWYSCTSDGTTAPAFSARYTSALEGCRLGIGLDGRIYQYPSFVTEIINWETDTFSHAAAPVAGTDYDVTIYLFGPYGDILDTEKVTLKGVGE